jgi:hypothetical protein
MAADVLRDGDHPELLTTANTVDPIRPASASRDPYRLSRQRQCHSPVTAQMVPKKKDCYFFGWGCRGVRVGVSLAAPLCLAGPIVIQGVKRWSTSPTLNLPYLPPFTPPLSTCT